MKSISLAVLMLALTGVITTASAQEVLIPDPGLNAAIREALQKPSEPLSEQDLLSLTVLNAHSRNISSIVGLEAARNLNTLLLYSNRLTNVLLPSLTNLVALDLSGNSLTNLTLPPGLTNLVTFVLSDNQLTMLTLPPDMDQLSSLVLNGNPLTTLVLSEPLAASTNLTGTLDTLRDQGVQVFTYPLTVQLTFPRQQPIGAFRFGIAGPPGVYTVYSSTNAATWDALDFVNNPLGGIFFTDVTAHSFTQKFYGALLATPPTNMVFIPPNTFTMGSSTNDLDSSVNERPQTTVLLTRGYWIGKYEVTQGEYLSLMNTNPSTFPGDLSRPVENVTWLDATNYCAKLTELDLAAGRIPPGSRYRLPTEAEWECAARAGTTTRFSYGDDPDYASTTNYAWFLDLAILDLTTHPVGQKLPNPWGLYDMHGNVWEWCQDWYDAPPGGVQIDPSGPAAPVQFDDKVLRGGAYDYPNSSCRSASRIFRSTLWPDSDVGFRVVLVTEP